MSDEQTIYISPEDDLTTIRERLENIASRRVTLVIPSHTQLRSHVAWKLLYARSRELGKEVLIVSSDPQVRSVAHAVKFKVANSLESNAPGRSRPAGRPTRNNTGRSKSPLGRVGAPKAGVRSTNNLRPRPPEPEEEQWYAPLPEKQEAAPANRVPHDYHIEEVDGDDITELSPSPRYGRTNQPRQRPFEQRIDQPSALPHIRPVPPEQIEEEAAMLAADYAQAQDIREAAGSGLSEPERSAIPSTPGLTGQVPPLVARGGQIRAVPEPTDDDPFSHEIDSQPVSVKEQRGHATIEDPDTRESEVQDVAEMPTSVLDVETPQSVPDHQIEYHGDNDDYLPPAPRPDDQSSWHSPETPKEEGTARRGQGNRSRRGRSGYLVPPLESEEEQTAQAHQTPIEDYNTQINPRPFVEPQTSSVSRTGREPDPVQLPSTNRAAPRPASRRSGDLRTMAGSGGPRSGDLRNRGTGTISPTGSTSTTRTTPRAQRPVGAPMIVDPRKPVRTARRRWSVILPIVAILILLLALALLAYAIPTTQITLTVAGHNYAHNVDLVAAENNASAQLPARSVVQEFRQKGSGHATGSKMLGTAIAKGFVCFTNKNDASVEIPTGSVVSASNGVQFITTADGVVLGHNTCVNDPLTFPVQAAKAGETGNVPAGSITVIPDNSLDAIAKYNKVAASSLKLSVNNSEDVKGGGMQPVPAVTDKDLNNAKTDLSNQLKDEINGWVQSLGKNGVTGNVTTDATLVDAPARDTTIDNGTTFPAEVAVRATVMFVANSDLQRATINQLNTDIGSDKNYTGYVIAQDARPPVVISQLKKQISTNSLKLSFNASAQAIPLIPKETVQKLVSGKTPDAAHRLLQTNIRGVQDARIEVTPSFFPWVSWWPAHINVTTLPGSTSNSSPART